MAVLFFPLNCEDFLEILSEVTKPELKCPSENVLMNPKRFYCTENKRMIGLWILMV